MIIKILVFRPFQCKEKVKTNSVSKHNKQVSHGIVNLMIRMQQQAPSEVTFIKYDKILKD